MRIKKRPICLNDLVEKPDESGDVESTNKKLKEAGDVDKSDLEEKDQRQNSLELEEQCVVCEEKLRLGTEHEDIETPTGSSESSYAAILNTVFNNSKHPFSSGKICLSCKVHIKKLSLLQNQVNLVKKDLLTRASKKLEGNSVEQEQEEVSGQDTEVDIVEEEVVVDENDVTKAKQKKRPKYKNMLNRKNLHSQYLHVY